MPNERHYSNELNLESVGINLPYNMQAEQSVLGAVLLKPETLTDLVEICLLYTSCRAGRAAARRRHRAEPRCHCAGELKTGDKTDTGKGTAAGF